MELALEAHKLSLALAAQSSAGTQANGATLDMAGFDGVLIFTTITTSNAGNFLKAQQGAAADGSDMADLAGSKVIAAADASIVCIDLFKPQEQYVRGSVIRAGANTALTPMFYLRYNAHSKPQDSDVANVLKSLKLVSPAEGTP